MKVVSEASTLAPFPEFNVDFGGKTPVLSENSGHGGGSGSVELPWITCAAGVRRGLPFRSILMNRSTCGDTSGAPQGMVSVESRGLRTMTVLLPIRATRTTPNRRFEIPPGK